MNKFNFKDARIRKNKRLSVDRVRLFAAGLCLPEVNSLQAWFEMRGPVDKIPMLFCEVTHTALDCSSTSKHYVMHHDVMANCYRQRYLSYV